MPRMKRPKSVRLNLEISPEVRDRIEALRHRTEAESLTEVIRRSLAVYETLVKLSNRHRIVIRPPSGEERELVLVP